MTTNLLPEPTALIEQRLDEWMKSGATGPRLPEVVAKLYVELLACGINQLSQQAGSQNRINYQNSQAILATNWTRIWP